MALRGIDMLVDFIQAKGGMLLRYGLRQVGLDLVEAGGCFLNVGWKIGEFLDLANFNETVVRAGADP